MNASSESGLWAMLISRTAVETDEDDILEILQHSGGSCGQPKKSTPQLKIFSYAMRMHVPRASLNTVTPFPQASVPAELRSLGCSEPDEAIEVQSEADTAWPQW